MVREEMEIAAHEIGGIDQVPDVMSIVAFDKNAVRLQVAVVCPVGCTPLFCQSRGIRPDLSAGLYAGEE